MRVLLLLVALLALPPAARAQEVGSVAPGAVRLSQMANASDEELVRLFFGPARTFPVVGYRDRESRSATRSRCCCARASHSTAPCARRIIPASARASG